MHWRASPQPSQCQASKSLCAALSAISQAKSCHVDEMAPCRAISQALDELQPPDPRRSPSVRECIMRAFSAS